MGIQIPHARGNFEGDDVGVFPHTDQHRLHGPVVLMSGFPRMLSTSFLAGRPHKQSSVTLNFLNEKSLPAMQHLVKNV